MKGREENREKMGMKENENRSRKEEDEKEKHARRDWIKDGKGK